MYKKCSLCKNYSWVVGIIGGECHYTIENK
jgi:hypothetical protein